MRTKLTGMHNEVRSYNNKQTTRRQSFPVFVWVIAISTMVACIGGTQFLGYNIAGYAWVVPLFISFIIFLTQQGKIHLPVMIWMPWIFVVIGYLIFAETQNALQRSLMLLCPIFIGMTVSKFDVGEEKLKYFWSLCRHMTISLYIVVIVKTGMIVTGSLPEITGLAPQVMTGVLLCTFFATNYALGEKRAFLWWAALAAIPVIALTRMGIIAAGASLMGTFAPMRIRKRALLIVLIALLVSPIFYSERVQKKMFYSGQGTLSEASFDNPNFRTLGRKFMWEAMEYEIAKKPWFGHGANSSEPFVSMLTGGLTHPHNDWLRLLYEYGYFGAVVFGFCMAGQVLHILRRARYATGKTKTLLYTGASSFIVFVLFMFTDNIILYAAFFGNLQFTTLGLAYAAYATSLKDNKQSDIAFQRSWYNKIYTVIFYESSLGK